MKLKADQTCDEAQLGDTAKLTSLHFIAYIAC